jgi:sterol desaturase/sphingolipid hydroxylase (fatty acid hydroxylase superfamily)
MDNFIDILPVVPSLSFLVSATFYYLLDKFGLFQDYNFHKDTPRSYDLRDISFRVFAIQAITTTISFLNHYFTKEEVHNEIASNQNGFVWSIIKILLGMLTIDTFQFWSHYALHSPFLFRQFHMVHHMITKTYSFMAFYNSYTEGILMDIVGAIITQRLCYLNALQFNVLIAIATMKAVSDHSGYMIPWDPFTWFPNNANYHQKHHNPKTMGFNYEQPFFTFWDGLMGTRLMS